VTVHLQARETEKKNKGDIWEECDRLREVFCKVKYPGHLINMAIKKLIETKVSDPDGHC